MSSSWFLLNVAAGNEGDGGTIPSFLSGLTVDLRRENAILDVGGVNPWTNLGLLSNLTANVEANRPQLIATAVSSDAVDDRMAIGSGADTVFSNAGCSGSARIAYNGKTALNRQWQAAHRIGSPPLNFRIDATTVSARNGSTVLLTTAHGKATDEFFVYQWRYGGAGTALEQRIDGGLWTTSATWTLTLGAADDFAIMGTSAAAAVDMSHDVVYNEDHSRAQIEGLYNWMKDQS